MFNGGIAISYAGVTLNADTTLGRTDGSNALDPSGGAPMAAELVGLSYAFGPFSVGADAAIIDSQGSQELVHTSQRHEVAFAIGGAYKIAPGLNLALEYQYEQKHQGAYNFNSGANGVASGNDIHGQGLTVATIVNW
jgi:predicted porin